MWIGTSAGLYLLDKESGRFQYVALQEETTYINTLYQAEDLSLYIGTNGSGVVVYNAKDSTFKHYHKDNCALISNNIYTILPFIFGFEQESEPAVIRQFVGMQRRCGAII